MSIVDVSDCPNSLYDGLYGGHSGDKEGIIYNNKNYMVKYVKTTYGMKVDPSQVPYTSSHISEYIGSGIYDILGYDVHKTMLVVRNGNIAVACEDFTDSNNILLTLSTLLTVDRYKYMDLLKEKYFESKGHEVELTELLFHFDKNRILKNIPALKRRFFDLAVIDCLIDNKDRNNDNWGLLRHANGDLTLAPVYDNGNAFKTKISESKMEAQLNNPQLLKSALSDTYSIFRLKGAKVTFEQLLNGDDENLVQSLYYNVPLIMDKLSEIYAFIDSIPEKYGDKLVCSKVRKEYYKRLISTRFEEILVPAYTRSYNVISKDRVRFDLLRHAQFQNKHVKDVITELARLIPSTYNSEKYSHAVRAWITLQIQRGNILSESDLIKLKELSNE